MLTVEAHATNTLLNWLLTPDQGEPVSNDDARAAAELLARQAHRKLGAGITDWAVANAWPELCIPALKTPGPDPVGDLIGGVMDELGRRPDGAP